MFFGIILGIILTVGAAYLSDSILNMSGPEGSTGRPMINWHVVAHHIKTLLCKLQGSWARLTGKAKDQ